MAVLDFPPRESAPAIRGPERQGHDVIIDGRLIPQMHMHEYPGEIEFILDGRLGYTFPKELAHHVAHFAATAMAIGAGYSFIGGTTGEAGDAQ